MALAYTSSFQEALLDLRVKLDAQYFVAYCNGKQLLTDIRSRH